jgi:hypothetical protein
MDAKNRLINTDTLGLNANGETVAVLPTSVVQLGQGDVGTPGPSYTLTGSGSKYETYQLVEAPGTTTANLFINGNQVLSSYTGDPDFVANYVGLAFGVESGGTANFNYVGLSAGTPVPEPWTWTMMGLGFVGLAFAGYRPKTPARGQTQHFRTL